MNLIQQAASVANFLKSQKLRIVTAESCTGGQIAEILTSIPGSSAWFERGFVTYSNEAKQEMLGVKAETIAKYGAVSEQTVREMAQGALLHSHANLAIAVTGIAGPGGGTPEKPVGLVWFAIVNQSNGAQVFQQNFLGDRLSIRAEATLFILKKLMGE